MQVLPKRVDLTHVFLPTPPHARTCTQEEGAWACSLPFSLPAERAQGGQDRRGPWSPALRRSFLRARGRCRGQEASPVCARIVLSAPDTASFTQNRAGDRPSAPHSGTQRPPPPPPRSVSTPCGLGLTLKGSAVAGTETQAPTSSTEQDLPGGGATHSRLR